MAAKKGGRGEMVLESRHLFGLFILFAVLFGVVFTLGYLLGKGQGDSQPRIAAVRPDDSADAPADDPSASAPAAPAAPSNSASGDRPAAPAAPAASTASAGTDWSFYHSSDSKPANNVLEPAPTSKPASTSKPAAAPAPASSAASKPAASPNSKPGVTAGSPMIPKGAVVLQVAAVEKESDALAMAEALDQRKFPAFVLPAGADQYYRVQVGPYADMQAANAAQKLLESQGFKSIVKR
jgi:cell division septation protein DedD